MLMRVFREARQKVRKSRRVMQMFFVKGRRDFFFLFEFGIGGVHTKYDRARFLQRGGGVLSCQDVLN